MAKAAGNITMGKPFARHLQDGTLKPYSIVRFYGEGTPAKFIGRDYYISGWYRSGEGYTATITTLLADTVINLKDTSKIAVYTDQDDAKRDWKDQVAEYRAAMAAKDYDRCAELLPI